jgi:hypothetical protein
MHEQQEQTENEVYWVIRKCNVDAMSRLTHVLTKSSTVLEDVAHGIHGLTVS